MHHGNNMLSPNVIPKTNTAPTPSPSWSGVRKKVAVIAGEGHRQRLSMTPLEQDRQDVATEKEALRVLDILQSSEFFLGLPEKSRNMLIKEAEERKDGKVHALEDLARKEQAEELDEYQANIEDQRQREKEDEANRLGFLWGHRSKRVNWTLLALFHITVLMNIIVCLLESYRIIIEHSKFDSLDRAKDFNCLHIINNGDAVNHMVNIFHGFLCVCVIYADRSETANILWALVCAQILHAGNDFFQWLYNYRFDRSPQEKIGATTISFIFFTTIQVLGALVVIQRYYDMAGVMNKRKHRFTSAIYSGRLLNEQIIYQNESTFLQTKYTMRQATALEIYGIVQKIHHHRVRGLEPDVDEMRGDLAAGIEALRVVQSYDGPEMLKRLRKRNAKRLASLKNTLGTKTDDKYFLDTTSVKHLLKNESNIKGDIL